MIEWSPALTVIIAIVCASPPSSPFNGRYLRSGAKPASVPHQPSDRDSAQS
ncbi:putative lipoprotein [Burkholderia pseudomallei]|nr:putative lipoprotein [Burkholderia pseudomallei]